MARNGRSCDVGIGRLARVIVRTYTISSILGVRGTGIGVLGRGVLQFRNSFQRAPFPVRLSIRRSTKIPLDSQPWRLHMSCEEFPLKVTFSELGASGRTGQSK